MKKVFSNSLQTLHVFAQQSQFEGRSSNVFFEGATAYSYGRHYPLATFIDDKTVVINASGYSVTTNKHIREVRSATSHCKQFVIDDTRVMDGLIVAHRFEFSPVLAQTTLNDGIGLATRIYLQNLANDTIKRKAATLEKKRQALLANVQPYIELLEHYKLKMSKENKKTLATITGANVDDILENAKKAKAKADKAKALAEAKRIKERQHLIALAIPAWLAGESNAITTPDNVNHSIKSLMHDTGQVYMRVNGDNIETSRGATFPLDHGLKALPLIRAIVAKGETWQRNGKTIHLGHYQIDTIKDGFIVAGCHTLPISEVERLAATLGV